MSDADELDDCWATIRQVPGPAQNNTVSMAVALNRITTAVHRFCERTHTAREGKTGVQFTPGTEDDEWAAVLTNPPKCFSNLKEPDFRIGLNEALHVLFVRLHDAILSHLLEKREESSELRKKARTLDFESFELERIRQALGGFQPEQVLLPFPGIEGGVNVESYITERVKLDPADKIECPDDPPPDAIDAMVEHAQVKRREKAAAKLDQVFDDDEIPF